MAPHSSLALIAALAAATLPGPVAAQTKPASPAAAGKLVFMRCMACHSVEKNGPNKVGPNLSGVVGRKSGAVAGFRYSPALAAAQLTWNEATLDKWLLRPAGLVPGTSMVFAGLPKPEDRAKLIAYLKKPVP
ncbi:c-type cytochrome [Novosphingobium piscinae]|uniref:Cytochrome c family protein n=1 Tax=Novosphingobium piscinae TaxID=1507448 RepID=A0A7X1KQM4_9SPHN|nr:cytochrome c family protein [Novosphingobium piscinae]MBC2669884.1 cytochrome c family protein [Novosphingobium piscinae]